MTPEYSMDHLYIPTTITCHMNIVLITYIPTTIT